MMLSFWHLNQSLEMALALHVLTDDRESTLLAENAALRAQLTDVLRQLDWFKRQLFGRKSEKRIDIDAPHQANLLAGLGLMPQPVTPAKTEIVSYERSKKSRDGSMVSDTGLRFDETVPVETIEVPNPALADVPEDQQERISEKITYRLAQRPGCYVVLRYVRKVVKDVATQTIHTAAMPVNVLEKSLADVSFLAGMLVDKFNYHLPLYRQHQRLAQAGITLSRNTLTQLVSRAIQLLAPIVDAQMENILLSRVLAMDETPIKAGRKEKGKMRQAYFWPVYGEQDEIVFYFTQTRGHHHVKEILGENFPGTLLSDGYAAYDRYVAASKDTVLAQCWSHTRRGFDAALSAEPQAAEEAMALIGVLYRHEEDIRQLSLAGEAKLAYRTKHSEPVVKAFWQWCEQQCQRTDLMPQNPLSKALKYAMSRQVELQVFLSNPDVPLDTNHVERALRVIPLGRKNWMFCWTEIGAKHVGIIQSLLVTCKLHGIDPYIYLVDVLQRVGQHPASKVIELTPRVWKEKFAANPLRSDVDRAWCQ